MKTSIDKEFTLYEEALALKELGFDEPCMKEFHIQELLDNSTGCEMTNTDLVELYGEQDVIATPTYSQAFRWFRQTHGLKHDIDDSCKGTKFYYRIKSHTDKFDNFDDIFLLIQKEKDWSKLEFNSYEEAELACLKKLIEIVKK